MFKPKTLLLAFVAGFIATLVFHQGLLQLLHLAGKIPVAAWNMDPTPPLGVPKVVISTIAYSHLIPAERITPDLIMVLWAGGLYGLNSICKAILSQAAGAVLGACRGVVSPQTLRPAVAISSLG